LLSSSSLWTSCDPRSAHAQFVCVCARVVLSLELCEPWSCVAIGRRWATSTSARVPRVPRPAATKSSSATRAITAAASDFLVFGLVGVRARCSRARRPSAGARNRGVSTKVFSRSTDYSTAAWTPWHGSSPLFSVLSFLVLFISIATNPSCSVAARQGSFRLNQERERERDATHTHTHGTSSTCTSTRC